jgi:hypothetical protein
MEKLMESDTWNAAAARVVKIIFQILNAEYVDISLGLHDVRRMYDEVWSTMSTNPELVAEAAFYNIGAAALNAAGAAGVEINEENLVETLVRKQSDYGPDNIARFGRDGIFVRLHDKIARLENLTASGRDPKNESVSDNYLDVLGYCSVGVMWETQEFLLPLTVVESNQE